MNVIEYCDTILTFQKFIWKQKLLKHIKSHPRHEQLIRLLVWNPTRNHKSPSFDLIFDWNIPEHEMHLVYTRKTEVINLNPL